MKYTSFGKTGLRVSQVAPGTDNFGKGWGYGADPAASTEVFNAYADAGGNRCSALLPGGFALWQLSQLF